MNFLKFWIAIIVLTVVNSCYTTIPVHQNFYTNGNQTGVLVMVYDISLVQEGARGVLDMALTSGNRFKIVLDTIAPNFYFNDQVKSEISKKLKEKGKAFKFLPDDFEITSLDRFKKPANSKLEYSAYDFGPLKETYGVDEVMVVWVRYGMVVGYYGMIETGKDGFAMIDTEIIRVDKNSLLAKEHVQSLGKMKGNWKKDNYSNLINAINNATNRTIEKWKSKF